MLVIRDDTGIAHLTAGSRNRKHQSHRERLLRADILHNRFPGIDIQSQSQRNRLAGIAYAASSDTEKEIHAFLSAKLHTASNQSNLRIRLHPRELDISDTSLLKLCGHFIIKPVLLNASASVMKQNLMKSLTLQETSDMGLRVRTKEHFRRNIVSKRYHCFLLLLMTAVRKTAYFVVFSL